MIDWDILTNTALLEIGLVWGFWKGWLGSSRWAAYIFLSRFGAKRTTKEQHDGQTT